MATSSMLDDIEWRRLHKRLWVARQGGVPLGMIERGRRFTVTDANDVARGAYRSFDAAQTALQRTATVTPPDSRTVAVPAPVLIASGVVVVAATVFAGWGLLLLT